MSPCSHETQNYQKSPCHMCRSAQPPDDENNPASGNFWPGTHESWFEALGGAAKQRQAVLDRIAAAYRVTLIRVVHAILPMRHKMDAEDVVQQFFVDRVFAPRADGTTLFDRYDKNRGRMRDLLKAALKHFVNSWLRAKSAQKRGGGLLMLDVDEMEEEPVEGWQASQADAVFDREWALGILSDAYGLMAKRYSGNPTHTALYHLLKPWLIGYQDDGRLDHLARENGVPPASLRQFLHRMLRQEWPKILRSVIAPTVAAPAQVEAELRYLCEVLAKPLQGPL